MEHNQPTNYKTVMLGCFQERRTKRALSANLTFLTFISSLAYNFWPSVIPWPDFRHHWPMKTIHWNATHENIFLLRWSANPELSPLRRTHTAKSSKRNARFWPTKAQDGYCAFPADVGGVTFPINNCAKELANERTKTVIRAWSVSWYLHPPANSHLSAWLGGIFARREFSLKHRHST